MSINEETPGGNPGLVSEIPQEETNMTIVQTNPTPVMNLLGDLESARSLDIHVAPNPLEVDWATEHLAHLPVVITMHEDRRVDHFRHDGEWFRQAGTITVSWEEGSKERFRIHLDQGATREDLKWLERRVAAARAGLFGKRHGWRPHASGASWFFRWGAGVGGPIEIFADEPVLEVCAEPWCMEEVHEDDGPAVHVSEKVESDDWTIEVTQCGESPWELYVQIGISDTLSVAQVADMVNDLRWAAASAAKLNNTQLAVA